MHRSSTPASKRIPAAFARPGPQCRRTYVIFPRRILTRWPSEVEEAPPMWTIDAPWNARGLAPSPRIHRIQLCPIRSAGLVPGSHRRRGDGRRPADLFGKSGEPAADGFQTQVRTGRYPGAAPDAGIDAGSRRDRPFRGGIARRPVDRQCTPVRQDYHHIELVICDNVSTDDTEMSAAISSGPTAGSSTTYSSTTLGC